VTGRLVKARRERHECDVPPTGDVAGVDPGDVWYCSCGAPRLAYHLAGSVYYIRWRRINRLHAWLRTR
jgi:hypothetical protein